VATRFFAVGALCPHGESGVGALSTQALVNPHYGPDGLAMLRDGAAPADVIRRLVEPDAGRAQRQVHMIDNAGRTAAHTGEECVPWFGHVQGDNASVAGNMLSGPQVVERTLARFLETAGKPLAERLIDALDAGEAAGGDSRGRQSAALKIYTTERWPELDIRVDDHVDPLPELRRLYSKSLERFAIFRRFIPSRANPVGTLDRREIEAAINKAHAGR
jgi:uncharacterized Ntn-hydrolase superfamily protein